MASAKPAAAALPETGGPARGRPTPTSFATLPETSPERLARDRTTNVRPVAAHTRPEAHLDDASEKPKTVLYLAYGSNLAASVFQGVRGTRPLSAVNVHVPSLRLTFDLSFMPYTEPCFANTALRRLPPAPKPPQPPLPVLPMPSPPSAPSHSAAATSKDDTDMPPEREWDLGLVGVVYELTPEDFAHTILTEGGGAAYTDILVPCFAIPKGGSTVPALPSGVPFLAHTLFAPYPKKNPLKPGPRLPGHHGGHGRSKSQTQTYVDPTILEEHVHSIDPALEKTAVLAVEQETLLSIAHAENQASVETDDDDADDPSWQYIDPSSTTHTSLVPMPRPHAHYAQPTPRYLELITTGAAEHGLPADYQAYLGSVHAYRGTTCGQAVGRWIVLNVWRRAMLAMMTLGMRHADERGRWPAWVVRVMSWIFASLWLWYDGFARKALGEGERTIGDEWKGQKA